MIVKRKGEGLLTEKDLDDALFDPFVYEAEYAFWPWGQLIKAVASWLRANAPQNSTIIDYMCGTGYLLNQIISERRDVRVFGCSLTKSFIEYAQKTYKKIQTTVSDVFDYIPTCQPDIVVCTGGLHHLQRDKQPEFIRKVASEISSGKYFLLGEEILRHFHSEQERKDSVLEMSTALIDFVKSQNAPSEIIKAAVHLQQRDLEESGEYKVSYEMINQILTPYFHIEKVQHVWPVDKQAYGDILVICRRR